MQFLRPEVSGGSLKGTMMRVAAFLIATFVTNSAALDNGVSHVIRTLHDIRSSPFCSVARCPFQSIASLYSRGRLSPGCFHSPMPLLAHAGLMAGCSDATSRVLDLERLVSVLARLCPGT